MSEIKIPLRPKNVSDFKIDKRAMDCLTYAVLTGVGNQAAFALFYPEWARLDDVKIEARIVLTDNGKRYCTQFFKREEHRQYMASYEASLRAFLGSTGGHKKANGEITEERKENALKSLLDKAMILVEGGGELDTDTLKNITDVFKKLGVLKDEVVTEELPRRYLPERCSSCEYKKFIDEQIELGNIEYEQE